MNDEERKDIANHMTERLAERHAQAMKNVNKETGEVTTPPLPEFEKMLEHLPEPPAEKHSVPFDDDDLLGIDFADKPVDPDKFLQAAGLAPVEGGKEGGSQGQGEAVGPHPSKGTPTKAERLREAEASINKNPAIVKDTPEFDALSSFEMTEDDVAHLTPAQVQSGYMKAQIQLVALVKEHRMTGLRAVMVRHAYERDCALKRGEIKLKAETAGKKLTVGDIDALVIVDMSTRELDADRWEVMASAGREAIEAKKYECDMLRSLNSALLTEFGNTNRS